MRINFFLIASLSVLSSCINEPENKTMRIKNEDGSYSEGKVFADSLFDGKVKYYDTLNNYLGYAIYKYGYKEGPEVRLSKSGKVTDSTIFRNGFQNGFAFKFEEGGKLRFKSYYLNGRPFGHVYSYDSSGVLSDYYFINFEGKMILEYFKKDTVEYRKGDQIQANIIDETDGEKTSQHLFLYLFASPFTPRHYEIGILDSTRKIILSDPIISDQCFYQQELPDLSGGEKYAIILHTYNSHKKRDDLIVRPIE
jgi:antitoxin component YwqK of YwqJK toxin-antitoxin module